jgi:hypothetical protein
LLSASRTGADTQFCAAPGYRTEKRMIVNQFFEAFRSVEQAGATKQTDYDKLLAAMTSAFGSVDAANEYIRNLMRDGMGNRWFELYQQNR